MTAHPIRRHGYDHMPGGQDPIWDDPWIYIGTLGDDGADDQLNANPPPFNPDIAGNPIIGTSYTYPYLPIPFQNGWTNYLNGFSPVCFMVTIENNLEIHGAITGGADGSVVFTLPDLSVSPPMPTVNTGPPVTQNGPWFFSPTPNAANPGNVMGTYWPLYPKSIITPLADGSGVAAFIIGVDGTVTYVTSGAL